MMNLKTLSRLYKKVTLFEGRKGNFVAADAAELNLLKTALDDSPNTGVHLIRPFDINEIAVGTQVELELSDPRIGLGLLADSFDDVLRFQKGKIKQSRFYLIDQAWYSEDDNPPAIVERYLAVLKLVELLSLIAAYLDKDTLQLVFVGSGKFIFPVQYIAQDLERIDLDSLSKLLVFLMIRSTKSKNLEFLKKSSIKITKRFLRNIDL